MTYLFCSIVLTLPVVAFCSEASKPKTLEDRLFYAIYTKNLPQVKKLIKQKVNVNTRDKDLDTPLTLACYLEENNIVNELLQAKADVSKQNNKGFSALMWSIWKNNLSLVKKLLATQANVQINLQDKRGDSPLLLTFSLHNPKDIIVELLNAGADIYQKNNAQESFMSRLQTAPDLKYDKEIQEALKNYHAREQAQNELLLDKNIPKDVATIIGGYSSAPPVTDTAMQEKPKSKLAQWFAKK